MFDLNRKADYIELNTDAGLVGCNVFISDERLKTIQGAATRPALARLGALDLIDCNYNAISACQA